MGGWKSIAEAGELAESCVILPKCNIYTAYGQFWCLHRSLCQKELIFKMHLTSLEFLIGG